MKKAILLTAVVLGLLVLGTPRSEACHTHGYVRASTLNDLFKGLPEGGDVSFSAGGLSGSQLSNPNLDTLNWNGGAGDNHQFSWSVNSKDGKTSFGGTNAADHVADDHSDVYSQLDGIIGDIELALDAQYDKDYAD
jgi:hypothetical protein